MVERVPRERFEDKDERIEHTINLAPNSLDLKLDGVTYTHGKTYKFTRQQLDTVLEIEGRSWAHEQDIGMAYSTGRGRSNNPQRAAGVRPGQHRYLD